MTNLRNHSSSDWLTRERLLVGIPVLFSGLILAALAMLMAVPAMVRMDALDKKIIDLKAKQQSLPNLRIQLLQAQQKQQELIVQQGMLVDLIAGQDRLATFLALLEQEAIASRVKITRYEPLPPVTSGAPSPERSSVPQGNNSNTTIEPSDPMTALGYRKTSVSLGVEGGYLNLQSFLQRMESLEILVEASDLALKSLPSETDETAPLTELALRLSFFDRRSQPTEEMTADEPA